MRVIVLVGVILSLAALDPFKERSIRIIEHRLALVLHHFGIDPTANVLPSEQIRQLAADPGKKLQAIGLYGEETGAGGFQGCLVALCIYPAPSKGPQCG